MFNFAKSTQMWLEGATEKTIGHTLDRAKKIANSTFNKIKEAEVEGVSLQEYAEYLPESYSEVTSEAKWAPKQIRKPIKDVLDFWNKPSPEEKEFVKKEMQKGGIGRVYIKEGNISPAEAKKQLSQNYRAMSMAMDFADAGTLKNITKEGMDVVDDILRKSDLDDRAQNLANSFKKILENSGTNRELLENTTEEAKRLKSIVSPGMLTKGLRKIGIAGKADLDDFLKHAKTKLDLSLPAEKTFKEITEGVGKRISRKDISPPKLNLDQIDAPKEIKNNFQTWVNDNAARLTEEYPHIEFDDIKNTIEKEGFNTQDALEKLSETFGKNPKKLLTAVQGVRRQAINVDKEIKTLHKALRETTDEGEIQDLTLKLLNKQTERDALLEAILGSGRISGQLLSFRRMTADALEQTSTGKLATLRKILGENFEPGSTTYKAFKRHLKNIDPNDTKAVVNFLRKANIPSLGDYLSSVWYNSVLSSPRTHFTNLAGNSLFGTIEATTTKPLSYLLDIPIAKLQGREAKIAKQEAVGYYGGILRGLRTGSERMVKVIKTGYDPDLVNNPSKWQNIVGQYPWEAEQAKIFGRKIDIPEFIQPILKKTGKGISIPTRMLIAGDAFFKGVFDEAAKFEDAVPKVWDEDKTIKQILDEAEYVARNNTDIIKKGQDYANYMTFNKAPGKLGKIMMKLREIPVVGRGLVPFVRVADNMIKRGVVDYSPVGLGKGLKKVVVNDPSAAIDMGRGIVGSSILLSGALLWKEGNITLDAPNTRAARDAFYRLGKQPWSIRVGKNWIPVRRIEPLAYPFFIGAMTMDQVEKGKMKEKKAVDIIQETATKTGGFILDSSYFTTIGNLWEGAMGAFEGDEEYGTDKLINSLTRMSSGFVPYGNALESIATSINPKITKYDIGLMQKFKSKIPGLRKDVPKRLTAFGEEAEYTGGRISSVFPFTSSTKTDDPVELELERLDYQIGFPSKTVSGRKLDQQEYRAYLILTGQTTKRSLARLIQSSSYQQMSQNKKRRIIELTTSRIRSKTRNNLFPYTKAYKKIYQIYRNKGLDKEQATIRADRAFKEFRQKAQNIQQD